MGKSIYYFFHSINITKANRMIIPLKVTILGCSLANALATPLSATEKSETNLLIGLQFLIIFVFIIYIIGICLIPKKKNK